MAHFYPSVISAFQALVGNSGQEGTCYWMYLDRKGLVTTGKGNLIDSVASAQDSRWHWLKPDGSGGWTAASPSDIEACWNAVKSHQELKDKGGYAFGQYSWNPLRLSASNIDSFVSSKIGEMEQTLLNGLKGLPGLPTAASFPADAQLALLRYAWAYGPAGTLRSSIVKLLRQAMPNFESAAQKVMLDSELNFSTKSMISQTFKNAQDVVNQGLSFSSVLYPKTIHSVLGVVKAVGGGSTGLGTAVIVAGVGYLGYKGYQAYKAGGNSEKANLTTKEHVEVAQPPEKSHE